MTLLLNAAIGGVTAAIRAQLGGRSFGRAFLRGAAGGAVVYGGKRVIAIPTDGMGFLGRQISAVGGSIVRNAGDGRSLLAGAVLPVGPVRLYINEPEADGVGRSLIRARLDLAGTIALGYYATRSGATFDLAASLAQGAPVLTNIRPSGPIHVAEQAAGVIALVNGLEGFQREQAITHESIHVAQYDFAFVAWSLPVERALWRTTFGEKTGPGRYLDLGLNEPARTLLERFIPYQDRPWEREAILLTENP